MINKAIKGSLQTQLYHIILHKICTILITPFDKDDEMSIFKEDTETRRMIFNIREDLASRLLLAKEEARSMGKRLDIETTINKAIEKFLLKAEKRIREEKKKQSGFEKKAGDGVLPDSKDIFESKITETDQP